MIAELRVLMIEDSKDDAELLIRQLRKGGYNPQWIMVETAEAVKRALDNEQWDIILCDYKMPNFNALDALKLLHEKNIDIPFIIVSGTIEEDIAVEAMKSGAHDFLMKDKLGKLIVTVQREIREAKNRQEKRISEEMLGMSEKNFRHSLENSPMGVRIVSIDGETIYANKEILNIYGYDSIEELNSTPHEARYTKESLAEHEIRKEKRKRGESVPSNYEIDIVRKNGEIRNLEVFRKQILWDGVLRFQALYNDITKRKEAENNLLDSKERYRLVVQNAHEYILITQDGKIVFANKSAEARIGLPIEKLSSRDFTRLIHPDDVDMVVDRHIRRLSGEVLPSNYTLRLIDNEGRIMWAEMNVTVIEWEKRPATLIFLKDITEHKMLDEERNESFDRLKKALDATVNAIAMIVETRDPYTTGHQMRVSLLAKAIAEEMELNDTKDFIVTAAIIHDIGKLSIPTEILSKPIKLSDLEYELIKTHSQSGYNILKDINFPWPVATVILQHHERINGSGYPQNLKGEEILIESRILAVADVVEAISSHRPYRASLGINYALDEISKNRGTLFDEKVVDACLKLFLKKNFTLS